MREIHINPVASAYGPVGAAVERFRYEVAYRNSIVSEGHAAVRHQYRKGSQGSGHRCGKVEFRHAGGMRPDSGDNDHDAEQFFGHQIVP
jgi:hypothetical protein